MKLTIVFLMLLTGCAYIPESVSVHYEPELLSNPRVEEMKSLFATLHVVDNRLRGDQVGRKKDSEGIETASLTLKGDLVEEISKALEVNLANQGYRIYRGDPVIQVDIEKFSNQFNRTFWGYRSEAELSLGVHIRGPHDELYYSRIIVGCGINDDAILSSGSNAQIALNRALKDGIDKLMRDPAFQNALAKIRKL